MKKIGIFIIVIVLSILMVSIGFAKSPAKPKAKIIFGHTSPRDNFYGLPAERFAELVSVYTNNEVKVEVHPGGALGSEQDAVHSCQMGTMHMTQISSFNLGAFSKSMNVLALPYSIESREEAFGRYGNGGLLFGSFGEELRERILKETGLKVLGWVSGDWRTLANSKKRVKTVEDLQGLKIRVPKNTVVIETFKSWGINPVPMAWMETFPALQQKVVDGYECGNDVHLRMGFHEVTDYVTELTYCLQLTPWIMNAKFFNSLPKIYQNAILRAASEATTWERWWIVKNDEKTKEILIKEKGMVIDQPADNEKEWKERAKRIWPKFVDFVGGQEWINTLLEHKRQLSSGR